MKNYWTKKECDWIIEKFKDNTAYFGNNILFGEPMNICGYTDGIMEFSNMYEFLRNKGFGEAETNIILACMIKCGAKFC